MKAFPAFIGGILLGGAAASVGFYFAARNYVPPELAILEKELNDLTKKHQILEEALKESWAAEKRASSKVKDLQREIRELEQMIVSTQQKMDDLNKPNHPSC